jgi:DNA polymerase
MLELLDDMILNCEKCDLYKEGRTKPYWTPISEYLIIGEAPGRQEVEKNEPFVGKAGKILGKYMSEMGFRKEQFLIINSINCRPTIGSKNGKPTLDQIINCYGWIKKYVQVLKPQKAITFGNFGMYVLSGKTSGILSENSSAEHNYKFDINFIKSIHPAYCIYDPKHGFDLLKKSIESFRKL